MNEKELESVKDFEDLYKEDVNDKKQKKKNNQKEEQVRQLKSDISNLEKQIGCFKKMIGRVSSEFDSKSRIVTLFTYLFSFEHTKDKRQFRIGVMFLSPFLIALSCFLSVNIYRRSIAQSVFKPSKSIVSTIFFGSEKGAQQLYFLTRDYVRVISYIVIIALIASCIILLYLTIKEVKRTLKTYKLTKNKELLLASLVKELKDFESELEEKKGVLNDLEGY